MEINSVLGIVSAVATLACALMAALLHRKTERIKIMENQLSDKKYKAYADLVGMFYDVLKDVKESKTTNPKRMQARMMDSKKDIFMYGSDKVFKAFNKWLCSTTENGTRQYTQINNLLNLMVQVRKDMCGNSSRINKHDLLLSWVQNSEEVDKYWEELRKMK